jgi:hypothetical protein
LSGVLRFGQKSPKTGGKVNYPDKRFGQNLPKTPFLSFFPKATRVYY